MTTQRYLTKRGAKRTAVYVTDNQQNGLTTCHCAVVHAFQAMQSAPNLVAVTYVVVQHDI